MPDVRRTIINVAIMLGVGLTLALLGPFGTFAAPFGLRLLYWEALLLGGYVLYFPAMLVSSRAAKRLMLPEPAMWAAACAFATVPMTAVVWWANAVWQPVHPPTIDEAIGLYGNVLIVGALACAALWFAKSRRIARSAANLSAALPLEPAASESPPAILAPSAPVPLLERLPPHLGTTLLGLEMEDHYVRAHTAAGSALILMRMRDAVALLGDIDGAQVHRSWWVARNAVVRSRREGRNHRLVLAGGLEAPVARERVAELEARGWL